MYVLDSECEFDAHDFLFWRQVFVCVDQTHGYVFETADFLIDEPALVRTSGKIK